MWPERNYVTYYEVLKPKETVLYPQQLINLNDKQPEYYFDLETSASY